MTHSAHSFEDIELHFNDAFGIFVRGPDEVQFRTGSLSGPSFVFTDPERRGLLGSLIDKILSSEAAETRPWNIAEREILEELVPKLREHGILEVDPEDGEPESDLVSPEPYVRKRLEDIRVGIVGHGVLGAAVADQLRKLGYGPVTIIESSSVAPRVSTKMGGVMPSEWPVMSGSEWRERPSGDRAWAAAIGNLDWVIAAQDSLEPEELAYLNAAVWKSNTPWSLVCIDGHEGWVGPTFVPGQTACFNCFRRRLLASAAEPAYLMTDPGVRVHRVPSSWAVGPEAAVWISLISSLFALDVVPAMRGVGFTIGQLLVVHRLNLTFQRESVLRLPRCGVCSPMHDSLTPNVFAHLLATREAQANDE